MSKDDELLQLVYVGPHDEVEVDQLDVETVLRGEPVDVPAWLAGEAPTGHRVDEDYDPGFGLLAQTDTWVTYDEFLTALQALSATEKPARRPRAAKPRKPKSAPESPPSDPNDDNAGDGSEEQVQ